MISEEEVKHIAKLARLELSGKEIKKMQKDLSAILDYFDLLKKVPKKNAEVYAEKRGNELRSDETISQNREVVEKIIASAPDTKDDYIKVKTVL